MSPFHKYCSVLLLLALPPWTESSPLPFPSAGGRSRHSADHPFANCTDCGRQQLLLAHIQQNIKQMQSLHSFKKRIMNAINRTDNDIPLLGQGMGSGTVTNKLAEAGAAGQSGSDSTEETGRRGADVHNSIITSDRSSWRNSRDGPDIVSLSRVVSSGRRKNILQFALNPAKRQGEEVEVVKAHLWLLLGTQQRRSGKGIGRIRDHSQGHSDVIMTPQIRSRRAATDTEENTLREADDAYDRQEEEERKDEKNVNKERQSRKKERPGEKSRDKRNKADHDSSSNRRKAVVRVLLLEEDGRKRLLTYLRTSVKETHWHKLNLPVGLVQRQFQQQNPTLTLMLRCGRCGRSVRMLLPKGKYSKGRKSRKQTSQNGKRREDGKRSKRKRSEVHLRAVRARHSLRKIRQQFRPSAFLVINTRIRKHPRP